MGACVRPEKGEPLILDKVNAIQVIDAFTTHRVEVAVDANADYSQTEAGKLSAHLESSGRSTSDQGKREEVAKKILTGMEKRTHKRNLKMQNGRAAPHHVSAHGPESDQISRLVIGRRSDELEKVDENTPKVKLTGNTQVGDVEVFATPKVGENPNTVSGKFKTHVAMLETLQEAYAQMALLDSHLSGLVKKAFDKRYAEILDVKEVKEALAEVGAARKLAQEAKGHLQKTDLNPKQAVLLLERSKELRREAEEAQERFREAFQNEAEKHKIVIPDEILLGQRRLARTVQPGPDTKDGIGVGYQIPDKSGVPRQKAKSNIGNKTTSTEEVIQKRYEAIETIETQQSANVVLDPSYVDVPMKGGKTKRVRAGWDVQTAYPVDDKPQQGFEKEGAVQDYIDLEIEVARLQNEIKVETQKRVATVKTFTDVEAELNSLDSGKKGKQNGLNGLQQSVSNAEQLVQTDDTEENRKKLEAAKLKLKEQLESINELDNQRPAVLQKVTDARIVRDIEVTAIDKRLQALKQDLEDAKKKQAK